jgi:hypothetical protein
MPATLASLPADVQRAIFFPDATYRAFAPSTVAMLDFHVWCRRIEAVLSDVRRLRFFASTDGTTLRVSKSHAIVRHELKLPTHYWRHVPQIDHLHGRRGRRDLN